MVSAGSDACRQSSFSLVSSHRPPPQSRSIVSWYCKTQRETVQRSGSNFQSGFTNCGEFSGRAMGVEVVGSGIDGGDEATNISFYIKSLSDGWVNLTSSRSAAFHRGRAHLMGVTPTERHRLREQRLNCVCVCVRKALGAEGFLHSNYGFTEDRRI